MSKKKDWSTWIGSTLGDVEVVCFLDENKTGVHDKVLCLDKITCQTYVVEINCLLNRGCRSPYTAHIYRGLSNTKQLKKGDIYGCLKIIAPGESRIDSRGKKKSTSICLCLNCGNIIIAVNNDIISGKTQSCGCIKSRLEKQTHTLLEQKYPFFIYNKGFDKKLIGPGGGMLKPDFVLYKVNSDMKSKLDVIAWIECQGEQHYNNSKYGAEQRLTDITKKEYCKENNILLYEIRYDDNVEERLDEILKELKLI